MHTMIELEGRDRREIFEEMAQAILTKQYFEVPFGVSQEMLFKAAERYLAFLRLPQELKDKLYEPHPYDPRDSGIGYVCKEKREGQSDGKEYFHYVPLADDYFADTLAKHIPQVDSFFQAARSIHKEALSAMQKIMSVLSIEFPGIYDRFFPEERHWPRIPLRFLKYNAQGKGQFLARGHYDIAGCTLALSESAPGLRIGRDESALAPVERAAGGALFMPAFNFSTLTDERFMPAWHDVVQHSDETLPDEGAARWAIVAFFMPKGMPTPSFEDVHRPLAGAPTKTAV